MNRVFTSPALISLISDWNQFEIILAEQDHSGYGLNTLGTLCLWQCFYKGTSSFMFKFRKVSIHFLVQHKCWGRSGRKVNFIVLTFCFSQRRRTVHVQLWKVIHSRGELKNCAYFDCVLLQPFSWTNMCAHFC